VRSYDDDDDDDDDFSMCHTAFVRLAKLHHSAALHLYGGHLKSLCKGNACVMTCSITQAAHAP